MAKIPPAKKERNERIYILWKEKKMSAGNISKMMQISRARVYQIIKRADLGNAQK